MNDLSDMLIKHRIVHELAIHDPEGFDGGKTFDAVNCIQTIISERERNFRAEIERLEAALLESRAAEEKAKQDRNRIGVEIRREFLHKLSEKEKECQRLREALQGYAECGDGCTCGDGWSHEPARAALAKEGR